MFWYVSSSSIRQVEGKAVSDLFCVCSKIFSSLTMSWPEHKVSCSVPSSDAPCCFLRGKNDPSIWTL